MSPRTRAIAAMASLACLLLGVDVHATVQQPLVASTHHTLDVRSGTGRFGWGLGYTARQDWRVGMYADLGALRVAVQHRRGAERRAGWHPVWTAQLGLAAAWLQRRPVLSAEAAAHLARDGDHHRVALGVSAGLLQAAGFTPGDGGRHPRVVRGELVGQWLMWRGRWLGGLMLAAGYDSELALSAHATLVAGVTL